MKRDINNRPDLTRLLTPSELGINQSNMNLSPKGQAAIGDTGSGGGEGTSAAEALGTAATIIGIVGAAAGVASQLNRSSSQGNTYTSRQSKLAPCPAYVPGRRIVIYRGRLSHCN